MPLLSSGFTVGFITGFGAGYATRSLAENPREKLTPAVTALLRAGVKLTERSRELAAHLGELIQDSFAEVRADLRKSARPDRPRKARRKPAARAAGGNVVDLHAARGE